MEYSGAAGVPIAVPFVWSQDVFPNFKKKMFSMIVFRTFKKSSFEKL